MINFKDIVKRDHINHAEYQKTLLSQHHNTSNEKTNKFLNFSNKQLGDILKEKIFQLF